MRIFRLLALLLVLLGGPALAQRAALDMLDVSQLARLRPVTVGMFSSY